jgi:hexosaminidase
MIPNNNGPFERFSERIDPVFNKEIINSGGFILDIVNLFLENVKSTDNLTALKINLIRDIKFKSEEYKIEVKDGIVAIIASDDRGVGNALKSLFQLTKNNGVSDMILGDLPKFWHREFMVDSARNFIPIDEIKKIIDQAALLKLNYLHFHLSDDQGWRIESLLYPKLHEVSGKDGYYTQQELKELVTYAQIR